MEKVEKFLRKTQKKKVNKLWQIVSFCILPDLHDDVWWWWWC